MRYDCDCKYRPREAVAVNSVLVTGSYLRQRHGRSACDIAQAEEELIGQFHGPIYG